MPGGVSEELAALHARRAEAEREVRGHIFAWMMEHGEGQTVGAIRQLADTLCNVASRAVMDAYNLPRPKHLGQLVAEDAARPVN